MSSTLLALAAIVIWSTLALLTTRVTELPSLLILGIVFLISGSPSLVMRRVWRNDWRILLVGVSGIFGYHFLYFNAFRLAPAVEVNLINYLWPLLIVLLAPLLLPGYSLRPRHVLAGVLGLIGATLLVTNGRFSAETGAPAGYLMAAGAALTWALYSILTKRLPPFSTGVVSQFCGLSGLLSLFIFFIQGGGVNTIPEITLRQWFYLALIGIGPMGAAFYLWDAALKKGDPRTIGSLAYLTPLLSTINLIIFGGKPVTVFALVALILIVCGAALGSMRSSNSV